MSTAGNKATDGTRTVPSASPADLYNEPRSTKVGVRATTPRVCWPRKWSFSRHGQTDSRASAGRPRRSDEGLKKGVTISTELHGCSTPFELKEKKTTGVVGPGDCG